MMVRLLAAKKAIESPYDLQILLHLQEATVRATGLVGFTALDPATAVGECPVISNRL